MADTSVSVEFLAKINPSTFKQTLEAMARQAAAFKIPLNFQNFSAGQVNRIVREATGARGAAASLGLSNTDFAKNYRNLKLLDNSLRNATTVSQELGRQLAITSKRFGAFLITSRAIYSVAGGFSQLTREAIQYERELSKIAQLTDRVVGGVSSIDRAITKASKSYGANALELANVAKILAEAGRGVGEIQTILNAFAPATLLPGFEDAGKNIQNLEAVLRQFNLKAEDTTRVIDLLNTASKNYSVSIDELFLGLQRAGSSFAVFSGSGPGAGETNFKALREFSAIFTSIISSSREAAEVVGTFIRATVPRLGRPSVQRKLSDFGIDLRDKNNPNLTATPFEAIGRIADRFIKLDARSAEAYKILEIVGAGRQSGRTAQALTQFGRAREAFANTGAGSVQRDADAVQEVTLIRFQKLRAEFASIIRDFIASDTAVALLRGLTDGLKNLLGVLNALKPILPGIVTAFAGIGLANLTLGAVPKFIQNFRPLLRNTGGGIPTMLTPGERVFDPREVNRIGANNLQKINNNNSIVPGTGNSDTFFATLQPGSFVLRKSATEKFLRRASGGGTGPENLGSISGGKFVSRDFANLVDIDLNRYSADLKRSVYDLSKEFTKAGNPIRSFVTLIQKTLTGLADTSNEAAVLAQIQRSVARQLGIQGGQPPVFNPRPGLPQAGNNQISIPGYLAASSELNRQPPALGYRTPSYNTPPRTTIATFGIRKPNINYPALPVPPLDDFDDAPGSVNVFQTPFNYRHDRPNNYGNGLTVTPLSFPGVTSTQSVIGPGATFTGGTILSAYPSTILPPNTLRPNSFGISSPPPPPPVISVPPNEFELFKQFNARQQINPNLLPLLGNTNLPSPILSGYGSPNNPPPPLNILNPFFQPKNDLSAARKARYAAGIASVNKLQNQSPGDFLKSIGFELGQNQDGKVTFALPKSSDQDLQNRLASALSQPAGFGYGNTAGFNKQPPGPGFFRRNLTNANNFLSRPAVQTGLGAAGLAATVIGGVIATSGAEQRNAGLQATGNAVSAAGFGASLGLAAGPVGAILGGLAGAIFGFATSIRGAKKQVEESKLDEAFNKIARSKTLKDSAGLLGGINESNAKITELDKTTTFGRFFGYKDKTGEEAARAARDRVAGQTEFLQGQVKTEALAALKGGKKSVKEVISDLGSNNPELVKLLALSNPESYLKKDGGLLRTDSGVTDSIEIEANKLFKGADPAMQLFAEQVLRLVDTERKQEEATKALNASIFESAARLEDFGNTTNVVLARLGRAERKAETIQSGIDQGFNRVEGKYEISPAQLANNFKDLTGLSIGSVQSSIGQLGNKFGLTGNANFGKISELAQLDALSKNEFRATLFNNPTQTLTEAVNSQFQSGGLFTGFSDELQDLITSRLEASLESAGDQDITVERAVAQGKLDSILGSLGGDGAARSVQVLDQVTELLQQQINRDAENQNKVNAARLGLDKQTIGNFGLADSNERRLRGLRGDGQFASGERLALAQTQSQRDLFQLLGLNALGSKEGNFAKQFFPNGVFPQGQDAFAFARSNNFESRASAGDIVKQIDTLRAKNPEDPQIQRLIEALKDTAEDVRELEAIEEELVQINKDKEDARSILDLATSSNFEDRFKLQQGLNVAGRLAAGEQVSQFAVNQAQPILRQLQGFSKDVRGELSTTFGVNPALGRLSNDELRNAEFANVVKNNPRLAGLANIASENNAKENQFIDAAKTAGKRQEEAARALTQEAGKELAKQVDLIKQASEAFNALIKKQFEDIALGVTGAAAKSANSINDAANNLAAAAAVIPPKIDLAVKDIKIVLPQAGILAGIQPQLQELISKEIAAALAKNNQPGVGGR